MNPEDVMLAFDQKLYELGRLEFEAEIASDFERVRQVRSLQTLPALQYFSELSQNELRTLAQVLPKRSRATLIQADPHFFTADDKRIVEEFLNQTSSRAHDYRNTECKRMFDEHFELKMSKALKPQARKLQKMLAQKAKASPVMKSWSRVHNAGTECSSHGKASRTAHPFDATVFRRAI